MTVPSDQPRSAGEPWCSTSHGMTPSRERTSSAIDDAVERQPDVELDEPAGRARRPRATEAAERGRQHAPASRMIGLADTGQSRGQWRGDDARARAARATRRRPGRRAAAALRGAGGPHPAAGGRRPAAASAAGCRPSASWPPRCTLSRATVTAAYAPAARAGLGRRPPGRRHVDRAAGRSGTAAPGCPAPARPRRASTWRTPRPPAPPQVPAAFAAALAELPAASCPGTATTPPGCPSCARGSPSGTPPAACRRRPSRCSSPPVRCTASTRASRRCCGAGDRVLVEHPTYPERAGRRPRRRGAPVPAAVDADDPAAWRRRRRRGRCAGPRPGAGLPHAGLPEPHRPAPRRRAAARRLAVGLAQAGTVAVVDETLVDLGLDVPPPPPLAGVRAARDGLRSGTLSKSVWGGLRIGWLRAEADASAG